MSDTEPSQRLSLTQSIALDQACGVVNFLLASDEIWTSYLTAAHEGRVGDIDFGGLLTLADRLDLGLVIAESIALEAQSVLESQPEISLLQGLERLNGELGPEWASQLINDLDRGDLQLTASSAWGWIGANAEDERAHLGSKRALLQEGELCDPDLRFRFRCMLVVAGFGATAVLAGAGVVATLGLGTTVALSAVATSGAVALAWRESGCGGEVQNGLGGH